MKGWPLVGYSTLIVTGVVVERPFRRHVISSFAADYQRVTISVWISSATETRAPFLLARDVPLGYADIWLTRGAGGCGSLCSGVAYKAHSRGSCTGFDPRDEDTFPFNGEGGKKIALWG